MSKKLNDESPMPFGKYKGQPLGYVPDDYLLWFLEQPWCGEWPDLVEYAELVGDTEDWAEYFDEELLYGGPA